MMFYMHCGQVNVVVQSSKCNGPEFSKPDLVLRITIHICNDCNVKLSRPQIAYL